MNWYLIAASLLCLLLGIIHSTLGEKMIFSKRQSSRDSINNPYKGILRATWHALSIFGFAIGFYLVDKSEYLLINLDIVFTVAFFLSGGLVFLFTKGKHPGWFVLVLISLLILLQI